jgi:phosphohistidine phosphatase SixA
MTFLLCLLSLPASGVLTGCATGSRDVPLADPVVVYLVRHAERAEDGTNDPSISEAGQARAQALATLLADAGIDHVHSTDLKRTRQTGGPLVEATGLPVEVYDPSDLPAFATALRATPGRHLVLGHSNTTPDLVAALGGDSGGAIDDAEYDRLYVVVIPASGPVSTVLLRYGAPYRPQGMTP